MATEKITDFEEEVTSRIARWEIGGRVRSPQELCADRRDLISAISSRIRAIKSFEGQLGIHDGAAPTSGTPKGLSLLGYELEDYIGRGRFGVVYQGRRLRSNRRVAIKIVQGGDHRRLKREADILRRIQSPHVVTILESSELSRSLFVLVMELVEGGNLKDAMDSSGGRVTETHALVWMKDVAVGMMAAFEESIIHRDLKPENVLIDENRRAKIADFGLATAISDCTPLTGSGSFMGTPMYMSPQQAECPHPGDTRNDIYSFGVTFYHVLTGRPPFEGNSLVSILFKHLTEPVIPAVELNPALSQRTSDLLDRCLAKQPTERFHTFGDIIDLLGEETAAPLWVYKCNTSADAEGDWNYFFEEMDGRGEWGGTWATRSASSLKSIREKLQVGDLVLAWQSDNDKRWALGLCRVIALPRDGDEVSIELEAVTRFAQPVKLLDHRDEMPAVRAGTLFAQGRVGTIFGATPAEAAEILRVCKVNPTDI